MNGYVRPAIEFETFELNSAIASGCGGQVSFSPISGSMDFCDDYEEIPMPQTAARPMSRASNVIFNDGDCYCTVSSTGDSFAS